MSGVTTPVPKGSDFVRKACMELPICVEVRHTFSFFVFHQFEVSNEVTNSCLTCDPLRYRLPLTHRDLPLTHRDLPLTIETAQRKSWRRSHIPVEEQIYESGC